MRFDGIERRGRHRVWLCWPAPISAVLGESMNGRWGGIDAICTESACVFASQAIEAWWWAQRSPEGLEDPVLKLAHDECCCASKFRQPWRIEMTGARERGDLFRGGFRRPRRHLLAAASHTQRKHKNDSPTSHVAQYAVNCLRREPFTQTLCLSQFLQIRRNPEQELSAHVSVALTNQLGRVGVCSKTSPSTPSRGRSSESTMVTRIAAAAERSTQAGDRRIQCRYAQRYGLRCQPRIWRRFNE